MDDCALGCKSGLLLLSMLMQLPCVRTLSFQRNNINDSAGRMSLLWLKPLSNALFLEQLSLSQNQLHDEAVLYMIKVLEAIAVVFYFCCLQTKSVYVNPDRCFYKTIRSFKVAAQPAQRSQKLSTTRTLPA
jgi:hypothetical protein